MGKYEFSKAILIVYCVIMLYLLVFMLINFIVISNGTAEDYSENIEEAIKNGRETGNIWYTRHRTNANKTKITTQYMLDITLRKQTQKT
jgi:hypothetical protein